MKQKVTQKQGVLILMYMLSCLLDIFEFMDTMACYTKFILYLKYSARDAKLSLFLVETYVLMNLAIQAHHRAFSRLIYRKMHKHTNLGFKIEAICCPDGYIFDFEPAVVGNRKLAPIAALLNLCRELPNSNYRLFTDILFVNMATITECCNLPQSAFLSGTVSKN